MALDPRRGIIDPTYPREDEERRVQKNIDLIPKHRVAKEGTLLDLRDYHHSERHLFHEHEKCYKRDRSCDRAEKKRSVSEDDDEWRRQAKHERCDAWRTEDQKAKRIRTRSASAIPNPQYWENKKRRLLSPLPVKRCKNGGYKFPDPEADAELFVADYDCWEYDVTEEEKEEYRRTHGGVIPGYDGVNRFGETPEQEGARRRRQRARRSEELAKQERMRRERDEPECEQKPEHDLSNRDHESRPSRRDGASSSSASERGTSHLRTFDRTKKTPVMFFRDLCRRAGKIKTSSSSANLEATP